MSCCRRPPPRRRQTSTICANCRGSLRNEVKARIEVEAAGRGPGTYRVAAEITCPSCHYRNRVPLTFSKV